MGLELQLEELIEQRERARVQGREKDAEDLGIEIGSVQAELASTAERAATEGSHDDPGPELHHAEQLGMPQTPE
jgi:hypothetical protein